MDEFWTHQTHSNLKFCLSSSKEKKIFLSSNNSTFIFKDIFLFCTKHFFFSVSTNQSKYRITMISSLNKFQFKNEEDF